MKLNHNKNQDATSASPSLFWEELWKKDSKAVNLSLDAHSWNNEIDERKVQLIRARLPITGTAVEVGCGSARLLARVGRSFSSNLQLIGVDLVPSALRLALNTAEYNKLALQPLYANAYQLPFESKSTSVILSGGLLEHFEDPRPILTEMVRVLKDDGLFYADVVPRKLSLYRLSEAVRMLRSSWLYENVYESTFNADDYSTWLKELGCEDINIIYCGVYPKVIKIIPSTIRHKILQLFYKLDGTLLAKNLGWYFIITARKSSLSNI